MADTIVPLNKQHNRPPFTCGNALLDRYFHQQVSQDIKSKTCTCFVLCEGDDPKVKGYYTLSSASIARELIPENVKKKFPLYHDLPVTLLGRLAVDENHKGQGLGAILLLDALHRSLTVSQTAVGSVAVIVDPIDDGAKQFYLKYGFIALPDSGKMFLPMKTIETLFSEKK